MEFKRTAMDFKIAIKKLSKLVFIKSETKCISGNFN